MKARVGSRGLTTVSLTSVLDVGGWSTPRTGALFPGVAWHPLYRRLDGPQGRFGRVRKILYCTGFNPRTVQPVANPYTDWAIPAYVSGVVAFWSGCRVYESNICSVTRSTEICHVDTVFVYVCVCMYNDFVYCLVTWFSTWWQFGSCSLPRARPGHEEDPFRRYTF